MQRHWLIRTPKKASRGSDVELAIEENSEKVLLCR